MRLVAGVLALTLFAPFAGADEPTAPPPASQAAPEASKAKVPLRVVRVMPESRQALLFDRGRATHVLAEVGGLVDGYVVDDIDEDEVTLSRDGRQIVLAAPAHHAARERIAAAPRPAPKLDAGPAPEDPYGASVAVAPGAGGVRVVTAPTADGSPAPREIEPGADGVRVARAPATDTSSAARTDSALADPPPGLRVVRAPDDGAPAGPPAQIAAAAPVATTATAAATTASTSVATAAPTTAATAPESAASAAPTPVASAAPTPAVSGVAVAPTPIVTTAPASASSAAPVASAAAPNEPHLAPAFPPVARPAAAKAPRARGAKAKPAPAPAKATGNKQTADALALADIMSSESASRSPRGPAGEAIAASPPAAAVPTAIPATSAGATTAAVPTAIPATSAGAATTTAAAVAASGGRTEVALARAEVDRALGDFAGLAGSMQASFSAEGVAVEAVADGSLVQRAGLRAGDLITSVNGVRLRSLDDAANLYAKAATASSFTVQLVRGGKPIALHVAVR